MGRVTFVLGLAGSGKSHLAAEICGRSGAKYFEGLYGPGKNQATKAAMLLHVAAGKDCVVEEIAYCIPHIRQAIASELVAAVPGIEIEWVCFENDLGSANWNVAHRTNKGDPAGHLVINQHFHALYAYPAGVIPRPITRI